MISKKAADLCAVVVTVGLVSLIAAGLDGEVKSLLGVVIGYLFFRGAQTIKNGGK